MRDQNAKLNKGEALTARVADLDFLGVSMLSNYKILTAVLLLFFSIVSVGAGQTQSKTAVEPVPKPKFGNGVLEEVSGAMERLLQLKWDGHNLALKRDWDTKSKKKNKKDDELEEAIEQMVERGLPEAQARLLFERAGNEGRFGGVRNFGMGMKQAGVEKAFNAIKAKAGANSMGSSSNGREKQLHFSGQNLSASAILAKDDVKFEFSENEGEERSFKVSDDGEGEFKFEFSFQLIWIDSDKVNAYVGESFSGFMKGNPKVANELLFPLLDRLGIRTPTGPPDP